MALQLEYPVKSTDMTASSAYVKIIQSNINFWDTTTWRVDFAIYSSTEAREEGNWPFETVICNVVDSIDTEAEDYDATNTDIDASVRLSEDALSSEWSTIRTQLYAFLKTQEKFTDALDV